MEHAVSAQASPDIAEIAALGAKIGMSIIGKEECRGFDVLAYLNLSRNLMPGGVCGKYRIMFD
ncbi:MAG: hypothetical protein H5T74_10935 [Actinobacteria bacterium]|nr:hypothetical protein [Actinomycetota bacterium]